MEGALWARLIHCVGPWRWRMTQGLFNALCTKQNSVYFFVCCSFNNQAMMTFTQIKNKECRSGEWWILETMLYKGDGMFCIILGCASSWRLQCLCTFNREANQAFSVWNATRCLLLQSDHFVPSSCAKELIIYWPETKFYFYVVRKNNQYFFWTLGQS